MKSSLDTLGASDCQMQFRFNVNSCPNTKRESFRWCALFPATAVAKTSMLLFKAKLKRATLHIALKSTIMDVLTVPSYFACAGHHQCLTGKKKCNKNTCKLAVSYSVFFSLQYRSSSRLTAQYPPPPFFFMR